MTEVLFLWTIRFWEIAIDYWEEVEFSGASTKLKTGK